MGRHGLVTGAVVAAVLAAGAVMLVPADVAAVLVADVTSAAPAAKAPAAKASPAAQRARKAASPAVGGAAAKARAASRAGVAKAACSCSGKKAAAVAKPLAANGPRVVTSQDPPSAVLVGPGSGGVDRGIADTGTHSDGTWHEHNWAKRYRPDSRVPLTVTPARGAVTLTWPHNGDPATIRYRVGYQPQTWVRSTTAEATWTLPPIVWVDVAPLGAKVEGTQTWTLRPATSGVRYSFWLEVEVSTPESTTNARMTVGQQAGVLVP